MMEDAILLNGAVLSVIAVTVLVRLLRLVPIGLAKVELRRRLRLGFLAAHPLRVH
jgi:hypothetical protein